MRAKSFEDLEVFQRAYRLSLEIHQVSLSLPAIEQGGNDGATSIRPSPR
jgi:hypothetical protein